MGKRGIVHKASIVSTGEPLMHEAPRILAIDDEPLLLELLMEYLKDRYQVTVMNSARDALEILRQDSFYDVILLDRMMPGMNGMQFMRAINGEPHLSHIPIIMQTAAAESRYYLEGIQAGVYYYLVKPFREQILHDLVAAAVNESAKRKHFYQRTHLFADTQSPFRITNTPFTFRTLEEAEELAYFIANQFPDPNRVMMGLLELMINAVEHGNLAISFDEKLRLIREGIWKEEIDRKLAQPQHQQKQATLIYCAKNGVHEVMIRDEGQGFDWKPYFLMDADDLARPTGRGIFTARLLAFDQLEYQGSGNTVVARVRS